MRTEILYLSPTYPGRVHDKMICDTEELLFEKKTSVFVDLGFLGLTSAIAQIVLPHKHKKNKELSQEEKLQNKWQSKVRVKVEHTIAGVKIFRKAKEKYRGRMMAREDTVMLIACALHNLKLKVKFTS